MEKATEKVTLPAKVLAYVRDPAVPIWRKASGLLAALYIIWPLDAVPDVIPIVGWLDDVGILSLAAWFMVREIRRHAARQRELPPSS